MSRKLREAEERARMAEARAAYYEQLAQQEAAEQAQKQKKPRVAYKLMNNCAPVPVGKPADFIQLTPIVQPIPLVPYSTQLQPLAMFDDDLDEE